jgi:hypothetical protein
VEGHRDVTRRRPGADAHPGDGKAPVEAKRHRAAALADKWGGSENIKVWEIVLYQSSIWAFSRP